MKRSPVSTLIRKLSALALAGGLFFSTGTHAQQAVFTFTDGDGVATFSPTSSALVDMSASDMGHFNAADTGFSTAQNSNGRYEGASGVHSFFTSTPKPAGADDPWFAVTLTPAAGVAVRLDGFAFGARSLTEPNVAAPAPGPRSYEIFTSADGFASPVASGNFMLELGDVNYWYWYQHSGLNVTGAVDAPLEVRLYFREAVAGVTRAGCFRVDDLTLAATPVYSEPQDPWIAYFGASTRVFDDAWISAEPFGWFNVSGWPNAWSHDLGGFVHISTVLDPADGLYWFDHGAASWIHTGPVLYPWYFNYSTREWGRY